MKIAHIADTHFGKDLKKVNFADADQPFWIERFLEDIVAEQVDVVVMAGDIYDDKILLSRKNVQKEALDWVKENLETGMIVNGIVKNIRKFGAFVEIGGGVVGLLHIKDISISRINNPSDRFRVGNQIKVMV